jgi:hypothetical protein
MPAAAMPTPAAGMTTTTPWMASTRITAMERTAPAKAAAARVAPAASDTVAPIAAIKEAKPGKWQYVGRWAVEVRQRQTSGAWIVIVSVWALIIHLCT